MICSHCTGDPAGCYIGVTYRDGVAYCVYCGREVPAGFLIKDVGHTVTSQKEENDLWNLWGDRVAGIDLDGHGKLDMDRAAIEEQISKLLEKGVLTATPREDRVSASWNAEAENELIRKSIIKGYEMAIDVAQAAQNEIPARLPIYAMRNRLYEMTATPYYEKRQVDVDDPKYADCGRTAILEAITEAREQDEKAKEILEACWIECPAGCGEYWCTVHKQHVADCDCPPIEEWSSWPYARGQS